MIKLLQGDCLELMKDIPDKSIDMILCDLPYGLTRNSWDSVISLDLLWTEYNRIIKPNRAIVLFSAQPFTSILISSNLSKFAYEWVWLKSRITGVLNAKKMPVRKHENILIFCDKKATGVYNPQGLIPKGTVTKQGNSSSNYGKRNTNAYIQEYTKIIMIRRSQFDINSIRSREIRIRPYFWEYNLTTVQYSINTFI